MVHLIPGQVRLGALRGRSGVRPGIGVHTILRTDSDSKFGIVTIGTNGSHST